MREISTCCSVTFIGQDAAVIWQVTREGTSCTVEEYAKCNDLLGIGRRDINESDGRKKSSKIIIYMKYM